MTVDFPVIISKGCGLDVHQSSIVAAIKGTDIKDEVKTFGTFTEEIYQLVTWLRGMVNPNFWRYQKLICSMNK